MNLFGKPTYTLCLDFGNSRKKCAVMSKAKVVIESHLNEDNIIGDLQQLVAEYQPEKSILSSVIEHDVQIEDYLAENTNFHKLSYKSEMPITLPLKGVGSTVGTDRWAMLVAATVEFPEMHNLAIGLGSCITFNFINKFREFLGGSISPGLYMRMKSMNQFTAKLPLVEPNWNFPLIGYDTKTNIQSGVILGISKEIDGMIDLYKERYSKFNVLLTGGDASLFLPHLKNKIFADPYLIYKGLYAISKINSK